MSKQKTLFDRPDMKGQPGQIFLAQGAPGPPLLKNCSKIMLEASTQLLTEADEEQFVFQYGPQYGDFEYLEEVTKFLSKEYGDEVRSDNLMLTAGATQGFVFSTTQLFPTGSVIFTEDPTYFIAIKMLENDLKMKVVAVPTDEHGILVDQLDELLTKHRPANFEKTPSRPFWTMIYIITVFNNPTGKSLPPDRCKELIQIARKHDVLLFTEDVYNLIHYEYTSHPPKRLLTYDNPSDPDFKGNVLSNGTFSKIFGPGLRLGWMEGPERVISLMKQSNMAWSGGSFNHYTSKLMTIVLRDGAQSKHLQQVRSIYRVYGWRKPEYPVKITEQKGAPVNSPKSWLRLYCTLLNVTMHCTAQTWDIQLRDIPLNGFHYTTVRCTVQSGPFGYEVGELTVGSNGICNFLTLASTFKSQCSSICIFKLHDLCCDPRSRMEALCAILKENLGSTISFQKPEGGFFLWVALPETINTTKLIKVSTEKYLVNYITGASTSPGGKFTNYLRLSISYCKDGEVEEGAQRICRLIKDALNNRLKG